MTKYSKLNTITLLCSGTIVSILLYLIYAQEFPNYYLIQDLPEGTARYDLKSEKNHSILLETSLTDAVNKTLTISLLSSDPDIDQSNLTINLIFNPLGQLFNGKIDLSINKVPSVHCDIQGVIPLNLKCSRLGTNEIVETQSDNFITIQKKPNSKYILHGINEKQILFLHNLLPNENQFKELKYDNP